MNSPVIGLRIPSVIFGVIGLLHLIRLLTELDVMIGSWHVPLWMSGAAVIVMGVLCVWLWRLSLPLKEHEAHSGDTTPHAPPAAAG